MLLKQLYIYKLKEIITVIGTYGIK
jgi:hypothetical protein